MSENAYSEAEKYYYSFDIERTALKKALTDLQLCLKEAPPHQKQRLKDEIALTKAEITEKEQNMRALKAQFDKDTQARKK